MYSRTRKIWTRNS